MATPIDRLEASHTLRGRQDSTAEYPRGFYEWDEIWSWGRSRLNEAVRTNLDIQFAVVAPRTPITDSAST